MRCPELSPDGRPNRGYTVKYRPSTHVRWRVASVWAPSKVEAILKVQRDRGAVLTKYTECNNTEPTP